MKKGMILDTDSVVHLPFFKDLFEKWKMELVLHNNAENFLVKFNMERPDFIILSTDLEIDYSKIIDYVSSKNCGIIFYGSKHKSFANIKNKWIKGVFPPPVEMDLIKLRNIFVAADAIKETFLTESISHVDLVTKEKIGIVELEGNISWEQIHDLKYHIIQLFSRKEIKAVILIFKYLEKSDHALFENIQHLFSFVPQLNLPPSLVQVIAQEERIKTMIRILPYFSKIEISDSYADAFFRIQGEEHLIKKIGIPLTSFNDATPAKNDLYSEFGELIKKKDDKFSRDEISKLEAQHIHKLYSEEELGYFGEIPLATVVEDKDGDLSNKKNGNGQNHKKQVLVIDDDTISLKLLKKVLTLMNFDVVAVSTGVEGFQYVSDHKPDLILVDLMMPGFNGVDFINTYKEIKGKDASPIMVVSAITKKEVIFPLIDIGVKEYLIKPIQIDLLMSKVNKIIKTG